MHPDQFKAILADHPDVSSEKCITVYRSYKAIRTVISLKRYLVSWADPVKSHSQAGTSYPGSQTRRITPGTRYPRISLFCRLRASGGKSIYTFSYPLDGFIKVTTADWCRMDRGGADLMMQLLRLDPVRRLTANEALDHGWFWVPPKTATKAKYVSSPPLISSAPHLGVRG